MDLTFLRWPLIIGVLALVGWLLSSSGVNYMFNKFTVSPPGTSTTVDEANEAGLSRLGGYCLRLTRYEKAMYIFETAISRFPNGKHRYYNEYRMVRCAEKMGDYARAAQILKSLAAANANSIDPDVPNNDVLQLRAEKLIETHELEKR